jgi:hypothetical protein
LCTTRLVCLGVSTQMPAELRVGWAGQPQTMRVLPRRGFLVELGGHDGHWAVPSFVSGRPVFVPSPGPHHPRPWETRTTHLPDEDHAYVFANHVFHTECDGKCPLA